MQKHEAHISHPINLLRNSYDFRDKENSKCVKFVDNMRSFPDCLLHMLAAWHYHSCYTNHQPHHSKAYGYFRRSSFSECFINHLWSLQRIHT